MRRWLIGIAIAVLLVQVAVIAIWWAKPETPAFLEKARRLRAGMTLEEANAIMGDEPHLYLATDNDFARCMWFGGSSHVLRASLDDEMRLVTAQFIDLDCRPTRSIDSLFDESIVERV